MIDIFVINKKYSTTFPDKIKMPRFNKKNKGNPLNNKFTKTNQSMNRIGKREMNDLWLFLNEITNSETNILCGFY